MRGQDGQDRYGAMLRQARLRPTRPRRAIARLLFGQGDRHVSAEGLYAEVFAAGERMSLATVYNTLNQFKQAGLVREIAVEGDRAYFDTNTSSHHHFYLEDEGRLVDIPDGSLEVSGIPAAPAGLRISHIDVVIRLVKSA